MDATPGTRTEPFMIRRNLSHRLKKLEARFEPQTKPFEFEIHFIEPGTMAVVSKRIIKDDEQKWWYAPGHAPSAESAVVGSEPTQMSADVLR